MQTRMGHVYVHGKTGPHKRLCPHVAATFLFTCTQGEGNGAENNQEIEQKKMCVD